MRNKNWNKHREIVKHRHNYKAQIKTYKKTRQNYRNIKYNPEYNNIKKNKFKTKYLEVIFPRIVNLEKNYDETIKAFDEILEIMKNNKGNFECRFNLEYIEDISNEVILYMLALIRNLKLRLTKDVSFRGNLPKNEIAKNKFIDSGFLNYMNTNNLFFKPNENKIQIKNGKKTDSIQTKDICAISSNILSKNKLFVRDLYEILIELQNNTVEHAYTCNKIFTSKEWYFHMESTDEYIEYTFLDTGSGIPNTVQKKFFEPVFDFFGKDLNLIESALNGDFRTNTKKDTRGRGLPRIKSSVLNGVIDNMTIYSGNEKCTISKENGITSFKKINFEGTLFKWKIKR